MIIKDKTKKIEELPLLWKELLSLLLKILSLVTVLLLLFTLVFGLIRYQEIAMNPAIKDGDLVIYYRYNRAGYLPQDVIVVKWEKQLQLRRVVAKAGDVVDISDEGLIINGSLQHEPNVLGKTQRYQEGIEFPLTVKDGEVFVLADNRSNATDSRIYGCVKIKDTYGKVMALIRRRSI